MRLFLILALLIAAGGPSAVRAQVPAPAPVSAASASPSPQPLPTVKPATDGKVWGALVYGSSQAAGAAAAPDSKAEAPPVELGDLEARLAKVFPYPHFEILGQHLQDVFREYESWVVPSKDLFLKVDSKGPASGGGMNLHLQFWRDQQVLVKTDTVLRPGSPLFIGGPKWRDGQLIFVLVLQSTPSAKR